MMKVENQSKISFLKNQLWSSINNASLFITDVIVGVAFAVLLVLACVYGEHFWLCVFCVCDEVSFRHYYINTYDYLRQWKLTGYDTNHPQSPIICIFSHFPNSS